MLTRGVCAALLALSIPSAAAQSSPEEPDGPTTSQPASLEEAVPEEPVPWFQQDRLTGDWFGGRALLEEHGLTLDLGLTTIYQHNAHGGVQTRNAHRVSGSYDLELTLDFDAAKLWKGGTLYALAEGGWDHGVSRYVGAYFGINTDAIGPEEIRLSELWYEHSFLDDKFRVRFGKLDLTLDFDTSAFANDETAQFLNLGLVNTGNVPFPWPAHGIQFVATPCDWFYCAAGVADADASVARTGFDTAYHGPANTFSVYEVGLTPRFATAWGQLPGHYRFGLWYDPQRKEKFFNDLDGRLRTVPTGRDDVGFYVNCDQVILREKPAIEGDEQGLGAFFRYGYAHADVNDMEHFWSIGGQYQGLVPTRDDDVLAFGVAQGVLSPDLHLTGADPHRETVLELYYNVHLLPWLTVSPDFQWVLRPGGENGRDAFVAGVRLQMAF